MNHALDTAFTKAARHQDGIVLSASGPTQDGTAQPSASTQLILTRTSGPSAVQQRFVQAFVRIRVLDVLADQADVDRAGRILEPVTPWRSSM
jgi:poly-gamma-glutamate capsule biosynthesis protein CapA/YwtB (metallophosphatase superfamily)